MNIVDNELLLYYDKFENPINSWPCRDKSALINILNTLYVYNIDEKGKAERHKVAQMIALEIVSTCKANNITPIFTNITPEVSNTVFFNTLTKKGSYYLNYEVPVMNDKDTTSIYNCGPIDPGHPSAYANTIYATKLYNFIKDSIHLKLQ